MIWAFAQLTEIINSRGLLVLIKLEDEVSNDGASFRYSEIDLWVCRIAVTV